jgi:hypothetical protein
MANEFIFPAWNTRLMEYGLAITQQKFLLQVIFRNHSFIKKVNHPHILSVFSPDSYNQADPLYNGKVYFLSFTSALSRDFEKLPQEDLANVEAVDKLLPSNTAEIDLSPLIAKFGNGYGIAFARLDQVGDYICSTKYFDCLPVTKN